MRRGLGITGDSISAPPCRARYGRRVATGWTPTTPGLLVLPSGRSVRGCPEHAAGVDCQRPDFGLYLAAAPLQVPHRDRRGPHLPALPLEGHAGRAAARRPGDRRAGGLVLPRARRLPPLVEVALGRADQAARTQAGPLPRLAPDASHLRRRRGPQRASQPRRDPLLGRLRQRRERCVLHLRRRGRDRRPRSRAGLRDRRRPERRPLRRRLVRRRDPAAARPPADPGPGSDVARRGRGGRP